MARPKKQPVEKTEERIEARTCKVKLKANVFLEDGKHWAGETVELEDRFAKTLMSAGKAEFIDE